MRTYEEALDFIHGIQRFGSKPGLRRVTMLLERMGRPQDRLKFIHVAGTSGKGSTCAMLSHIYTEAGYKTGLYISPFVLDFRERIQINNQMISKEELVRSVATVKAHWDVLDSMGEPPTEFEVVVAVAMDYFLRQQCDLVILEVGMGGRFDATNVIGRPLCSVITSIGIDHTEYLGDTIQQIAFEKCGIIKPDGVTVSYPRQDPEALAVIMEECAKQGNRLLMGNSAEVLEEDLFGSRFVYDQTEYHISLGGFHQILNSVTALETVKAVGLSGLNAEPEAVRKGSEETRFPARMEVICKKPLAVLDGAHNPAKIEALCGTLKLLGDKRIHLVMGMLRDKDVDACLRLILPYCVSLTAVTPDNPRAMPAEELAAMAQELGAEAAAAKNVAEGVTAAFRRCGPEDMLLACGSLYLASEMRPMLLELARSVTEE